MLNRLVTKLSGGRLQVVLIISFALVVALTIGLNAFVISRVISDYLTKAENERVARDMELANEFYQLKLDETAAISNRLVLDPWVVQNIKNAAQGYDTALKIIDQQITNKIAVLALGGTHLIAVLDRDGDLLVGRVLSTEGDLLPVIRSGNWGALPIVQEVLSSGESLAATEILPASLLAQVGLDEQAAIELIQTPKAAPQPYDPREGEAGFALTGVSPIIDEEGSVVGAVLAAYMFNNDFTLVDRIKEVAGIDTVTIFFGDLRVSTNVMTEEGKRAVGTRISQEVYDVVLDQGQDYVGEAFVVNDTFITRYEPLRDHLDRVVGSLYVGARKSTFEALLETFSNQVIIIAAFSMLLAAIIAIPIARFITRPIVDLVDANQRLENGDMSVRVHAEGNGELALLGRSFNSMVARLQNVQQELLHKEKLASMGQLAAGVAHEINNPLGTILLYSDMMYKETEAGEQQREDLKMIINEATRCKTIVADLLNFARQQDVLAQQTDVHELMDQVIETTSIQPTYDGVIIQRCYDPDLPMIQADPAQLQQVFINLFNNAAEAIDGEGMITISTRPVDNQFVEIKVSDTGNGIPSENLGKLFTPFFTTKPPGKGTGLGLSIVYGIIKMHRGQITVRSQVGEGTTFTVTLPTHLPEGGLTMSGSAANMIG